MVRAACSCRSRNYARNDLWLLRGAPAMFYYVILRCDGARLRALPLLFKSRIGYFWLAIREDEEAARAARHRHLPLQDVRGDGLGRA